ncbi:HK97 gp10 family phage protein [Candidatus Bathyarchaeota archaeon]|nr:HK97 gp10 family phage protein [Candidatus Bathyarchaeota archaeon]
MRIEATDVLRRLARKSEEYRKALSEELDRVASGIEATAKQLVPIRTGYLWSTIFHRIEGLTARVGAAAHYAAYVEFGTSRMAARPYLRPALEAHRGDLRELPRRAFLKISRSP